MIIGSFGKFNTSEFIYWMTVWYKGFWYYGRQKRTKSPTAQELTIIYTRKRTHKVTSQEAYHLGRSTSSAIRALHRILFVYSGQWNSIPTIVWNSGEMHCSLLQAEADLKSKHLSPQIIPDAPPKFLLIRRVGAEDLCQLGGLPSMDKAFGLSFSIT